MVLVGGVDHIAILLLDLREFRFELGDVSLARTDVTIGERNLAFERAYDAVSVVDARLQEFDLL